MFFVSFQLLNEIAWTQVEHIYGIQESNWDNSSSLLHQQLSFFRNVDNITRILDFTICLRDNPIIC